jgi:hypothetical protein
MSVSTIVGLTALLLLVAFSRLRIEPRRARLANWALVYPTLVLLFFYAWFGGQWINVGVSLALTAVIVLAWWAAWGRKLATPTSDNISVWGQDVKKPTMTEAQAEIERLKKEKEDLEKELQELKAKRNGKG